MASMLKTLFGQRKMALRWSCYVNDLRAGRLQHFLNIGKTFRNPQSFPQLFGHEQFPITESRNLAIRNPMNGLNVLVGDLTAANDSYAKHWKVDS